MARGISEVIEDFNHHSRELSAGDRGIYRPNLHYEVVRARNEGEKQLEIVRLLRENDGVGVIYAATAKAVKGITDYLGPLGFVVAAYHELLSASERETCQDRFMAGELKAIVATGLFGPGVIKPYIRPDIRFVIHYDAPGSLEVYCRESDLAGHDGLPARCTLLFQLVDRRTQLFITCGRYPAPRDASRIYEVLQLLRADLSPAPLQQIQENASEITKAKVRMSLSLLKDLNVVKEHRGARYTLRRRGLIAQEIERMADRRRGEDESGREKLERMMLYAQSPECRWKLLLDHLGEKGSVKECGHCDNCLHPVADQLAVAEGAVKPDFIDLLFTFHQQREESIRPGDVVRLPEHGEVKVKAVEGDKIVVSFPGGETRKFKQEWVIR